MINEINSGFFARTDQILPLLHILSSIFFICAQFNCICIVKTYMKENLENSHFDNILPALYRYEKWFIFFICIIAITGFFISYNTDYKFSDPMVEGILATKWAVTVFISFNFLYTHYKINMIKKSIRKNEILEANEYLIIVIKYFIPLNIVISIIGVYLGITIRGF